MMWWKVTFILFFCVFQTYSSTINNTKQYAPHISAILNNLNSNPNKIYDYKKGTFISYQQKADIEELTVDVDVSCTVNYPGVPCTQQVLTCNAFLRYNDGKYQVLSDVLCKPKTDSSTENVDVLDTDLTQSGAHHGSKLELSNEDISGGENADFVAVKVDKVPCVGCPFDLNTDVEGVSTLVNTALRHIESERNQKQVALKVHRLQQQVVAGVKYILTLEVAPTVCQKDVELLENCPLDPNGSSSFCEVIFLQKPWISKDKLIIGNNCTISQEYTTESKINSEITNDKGTKQLSSDQKVEEMSAQRLADMESQILIMCVENQKPVLKNKIENNFNPKKVEYSVSFGDPSNNEVLSLYKNSVRNDPLVATSPYNENQAAQQKPLQELDEVNNKKEEHNLQEGSREKRDILSLKHQSSDSDSDSSEENNQKRFVRDLKGINSHETSESQEDSKTEESFRFKRSQDLDETNSDTSESQEDNTRELVKPKRSALSFLKIPRAKRSIDGRSSSTKTEQNVSKNKIEKNDDSSDSSSSSSDDNNENEKSDHDNRIYVKGISNNKKKKNYDNSDSSSSSSDGDSKSNESDHDDNRSSLKHSRSKNSRSKTNDDSSDSSNSSSEEKSENRKSDSSSSSSDNNSENKKSDSSSSSSDEKSENRKSDSSSSSSDDNSENKKRDSSSSSSDDKSENRKSSSSSSSSSENSREENDIKYTNYVNHIQDTNERKHDISSNIKINKVKRSVGQLEKITQEEKFLVRDLAEFAASSLDDIDDDNHKRVILQILSAKKLKLDGIYYHIILRLGISQCSENEEDENCRENLFPNLTKICKVLVHVEDDLSNPKIVKSQCQNIKKDDRDRNRTNYGRYRRKIVVGASSDMSSHNPKMSRLTRDSETEQGKEVKDELVGGVQEESPDSLTATYYLEAILNHLNKELDNKDKLKVQKIISATSQVVAGTLWRIRAQVTSENKNQTCNFRIWSRPWINDTEVTQTCEDSETKSFRLRRSTGVVKYIIPSSVDNNEPNPKILQYVKKGLRYLDSKSDHKTKYIIKSIKKISKQIVAGKLWHVTADIALSDCPKQHYTQYCEELDDGTTKTCYFVIWEQPWLSDGMQINITCENDENTYSISPKDFHLVKTFYADESLDKFHEFIIKHNKTYLSEVDFNYRFKVFKDNLNRIKLLNNYEQGTAQYGITRFADLTEEEFSKSHGLRLDLHNDNEAPFSYAQIPDTDLPTEFDWRKKGAVTEVKNQGSCGSCWAFSTTGNIEGQYAIKYGKLLEFSEQELVDCDKLDEGCNGGLMDNAYRTIEKIGGLESESDYPYDAEDEKCHFDKTKARVQLSGAVNISHNEDDMAKWLVKNGPISIAINANAMQFYFGGVSHPWKILCNPKNLDHGVLIVGYGVHNYPRFNKTLPYWIVKNSWGPSWGEQGYYRVFRGDGTCGLNQTPSSAIVA